MFDTVEAVITYLKADSALAAAVTSGGRVWIVGPPMPKQYAGNKAVMVILSGNEFGTAHPLMTETLVCRCYGPTPWDARAVYLKLHDALHRSHVKTVSVTGGTATLCRASQVGGPSDRQEPELGWHYCEATFALWWIDRLVEED